MHKADCEIFAEYNSSMNKSVYTAAANLDNSALHLDRGAFFGSIIGTLYHRYAQSYFGCRYHLAKTFCTASGAV